MGLRETEKSTELVLKRMENTLSSMEQMSFDSINITDRLVTLTSDAKECISIIQVGSKEERERAIVSMNNLLDKVLETAFMVNNVSHDLEKETVYQRDTTENIKQIIEFMYAMTDDAMVF